MTEFRCGPNPAGTVQQCTYCGAPGHWTQAGLAGYYAAPNGHAVRSDGTLECPRSTGDSFVDAPRLSWVDGEATVAHWGGAEGGGEADLSKDPHSP